MKILLTIVVPTFNMQDYLNRCLDSLIVNRELMEQLEVLVVNDGSKDNSSAIAHEYENKYPRTFRVIDKENGNYGSCVNRGLQEARGKYIKVLDADDWFDIKNFESFLRFLESVDVDLVLSDFDQVDESGNVINHISYELPTDANNTLAMIPRNVLFLMHAVTHKTENLRKIDYRQTEGISYTDQEWIFIPMTTVHKVGYFGNVVYKYLVGRQGQTIDPAVFAKHISHEVKSLETMMRQFEKVKNGVNTEQYDYLVWRLRIRLHLVYYQFLVKSYKTMNVGDLVDLDMNMKKSFPSSYKISDELIISKRTPYRFIRAFRRFHTMNYPSIVLYRAYTSIKN